MTDNLGRGASWQAQSSQSWLTVTASGVAGGPMQIQADPSALATNTIHYATVSVKSSDSGVSAAQPVVVALWKGTESVREVATTAAVASRYTRLLADPVRPYAYAHSNSGMVADPVRPHVQLYSNSGTIDVYNIYTGALVKSMSAPGSTLGKMLASPDGAYLYAHDLAGRQLKVFDLREGQVVATWPLDASLSVFEGGLIDLIYARPNGVGVLVVSTGQVFRASDGKLLATKIAQMPNTDRLVHGLQPFRGLSSSYLAASLDGMRVFSTDSRLYMVPNTPFYWDMDYTETNEGTLSVTKAYAANLGTTLDAGLSQAGGIAMSRDGSRVLMLSAVAGISLWSPADLSKDRMLAQDLGLQSDTLNVTPDGNIVVAGSTFGQGSPQFHVLSPDGRLLKTQVTRIAASTVKPGSTGTISALTADMAVSADGNVAIQSAIHDVDTNFGYLLTFAPIRP
ncbi:MAG: hypothetical protein EOO32_04730 [Comamonadaceae bacterium]|nr:MAG: hypothetical protein EOO32_04730 [Comamonadaceae bacterium]